MATLSDRMYEHATAIAKAIRNAEDDGFEVNGAREVDGIDIDLYREGSFQFTIITLNEGDI